MMIEKMINANVLDVTDGKTYLATVEVADGIIKTITPQTEKMNDENALDLKGRYLSPGFIDTHSHLLMYSSFRKQLNCSADSVGSIKDIVEKFKQQKDDLLTDGWLQGYGYSEYDLEEQRHPDRFDLDKISTEIPIYIKHSSLHMGAVNTKALALMGVGLDDPDPKGGKYGRDTNGKVNGILFEFPALDKVKSVIPAIDAEVLASDIEAGVKEYQSRGITNTTEMGVGILSGIDDYKAVIKFLEQPQSIRTRWAIDYHLLLDDPEFKDVTAEALKEKIETLGKGYSTLEGAKFFSDGSIQLHTAAIRGDYYDGTPSDALQLEQKDLEKLYQHFQKLGYPLITHANGDYAARTVIEAYKNTADTKTTSIKNRVEHLQTVNQEDIEEMVNNDIGGSFFTNHIYHFGDIHKKYFLGPDRVQNLDPVRWAEDAGMTFTIHSDCPVTDISPLDSIRIAVERTTRQGELLGEHQKLSRLEAYRKMTLDAARLNGTEDKEGSVETGKYADFVILNDNPFDEDAQLSDDLVETTIVGGEVVFKK
ncbi:amidohydrolase [Salinicoccus sp. HZC-1]|uniref:amidohydrolase n=1 Tax=Salinicoccus sp. HZC-1 TaxID=3385497 RepID=UPI00398B19F0